MHDIFASPFASHNSGERWMAHRALGVVDSAPNGVAETGSWAAKLPVVAVGEVHCLRVQRRHTHTSQRHSTQWQRCVKPDMEQQFASWTGCCCGSVFCDEFVVVVCVCLLSALCAFTQLQLVCHMPYLFGAQLGVGRLGDGVADDYGGQFDRTPPCTTVTAAEASLPTSRYHHHNQRRNHDRGEGSQHTASFGRQSALKPGGVMMVNSNLPSWESERVKTSLGIVTVSM